MWRLAIELRNRVAVIWLPWENSFFYRKVNFSSEQLAALKSNEPSESKLSDLVALNIGQIGENMSLRRASAIGVPDSLKYVCIMSLLQLIPKKSIHF